MPFETQQYAYPRLFEEHWEAIREELRALHAPVLDLHRNLGTVEAFIARLERGTNGWTPSWQAGSDQINAGWLTYALRYTGRPAKGAAQKLPVTTTLLATIPGCHVAAFSLMKPLTVIGPHDHPDLRGSSLRIMHLGVDVVPGRSFLCVNGVFCEELPGRTLMFDGTGEHFALNAGDTDRVILYAEFDVSQW